MRTLKPCAFAVLCLYGLNSYAYDCADIVKMSHAAEDTVSAELAIQALTENDRFCCTPCLAQNHINALNNLIRDAANQTSLPYESQSVEEYKELCRNTALAENYITLSSQWVQFGAYEFRTNDRVCTITLKTQTTARITFN